MTGAMGVRIRWADVPAAVRAAVEQIIGDHVVEAVSQSGGFSPGSADRVRTADGRRAFVKAVSPAQNDRSTDLYRREAAVAAALPGQAPAPRLLGCHDDGDWVALVFDDVEGRHPATPWLPAERDAVLATLAAMATRLTPCPVRWLPTAPDHLAEDFGGWRRLADDPPAGLDPWVAGHLDRLCALADRGLAALDGDTLVHTDVRADNLLLGPDGGVTLVDWPWACRGPAWLDTLLLLVNVRLYGGDGTDAALTRAGAAAGADPDDLTGVLAGLAGFFADGARHPAPRGVPTVRAFQRAQAAAVVPWVRQRLEHGR